jgi:group I intron endonuclease
MGVIYKLTSPSGKSYIGQTIYFERRMKQHFQTKCSGCPYIKNAIKKYGSLIQQEILLEVDNNFLDFYEQKFIIAYNTLYPHGYNLKTGGGRQSECTQITKDKISRGVSSARKKEGAWVGDKNPQFGRKYAFPKSIDALNSFNHLPKSEEHKQKLRIKAKERFFSDTPNPWRDSIIASRKPVVKLDANDFLIESYESISEAIRNGAPTNLSYHVRTGKPRGNFYWYYL